MTIMIDWLDADALDAAIPQLSEILMAVVAQNASVGFVHPLAPAQAHAYWQGVASAVHARSKHLVVAYDTYNRIVGTAQIEPARAINGSHRAEVMKVLVHPDAQRHGIGLVLMQAVESYARTHGWTLLLLDTKRGDHGERLYARAGWVMFGEVPGYAYSPDGTLAGTSFWYKSLA